MVAGEQRLVHTPFVPSGYWSPCAPLVWNPYTSLLPDLSENLTIPILGEILSSNQCPSSTSSSLTSAPKTTTTTTSFSLTSSSSSSYPDDQLL
ncbi:unnamed protein product [Schistosoma mattheei]|uniref:Uncharacterized protein n=1 Tax=Schistosoma mattheei TaxID=31246 RepID=A0A183Q4Q2_9TREM|nr:unnamed protein product [Schistosoma mattheei]